MTEPSLLPIISFSYQRRIKDINKINNDSRIIVTTKVLQITVRIKNKTNNDNEGDF